MNVSILAFPSIDTVNLQFTVDFYLRLRWFDFRIAYRDLNNVTTLNSLSKTDREAIWTPKLDFLNALGPFQVIFELSTDSTKINRPVHSIRMY